ncbi:MAG: hypothetical protein JRI25_17630 [Deltaproteobacteria bacterium]|nr:hypothetical protein [Deltaproteobacteria bacterium]MBW2256399.1 hypothetical protein [Deltaproteobacteria bacterium]
MNIYLVPYNWTRHVVVSIAVGGAAFMAWLLFLHARVWLGPTLFDWGLLWRPGAEGPLLLGFVAATIAFTSIYTEHSLRRTGLIVRAIAAGIALGVAFVFTEIGYAVFFIIEGFLASEEMKEVVADPSLASHRHHLWMWLAAGFGSGLGPLVARKGKGIFSHIIGGVVAAGFGAAIWQYLGYNMFGDLYLAMGIGVFVWGLLHGALVWGIPNELYAGWVRVLSNYRHGYRIPIDKVEGGLSERFIGHFPRGLDLFLPVEQGVAELHTSFVVDDKHNYALRGLSQQPTGVKRFLERIDLRYDPTRPAPLEIELNSEDRIVMGDNANETEVEFILLPKEES